MFAGAVGVLADGAGYFFHFDCMVCSIDSFSSSTK